MPGQGKYTQYEPDKSTDDPSIKGRSSATQLRRSFNPPQQTKEQIIEKGNTWLRGGIGNTIEGNTNFAEGVRVDYANSPDFADGKVVDWRSGDPATLFVPNLNSPGEKKNEVNVTQQVQNMSDEAIKILNIQKIIDRNSQWKNPSLASQKSFVLVDRILQQGKSPASE